MASEISSEGHSASTVRRESPTSVACWRRRTATVAGVMLLAVGIWAASASAWAASEDGPLLNQPVYFPETKSYYELVQPSAGDQDHPGLGYDAIRWIMAKQRAQQRSYKGVRGRLAVVKSYALHNFLKTTFRPRRIIWIGLRYWCNVNKLQWVTGEFYPRSAFAPWARVWNNNGSPGAGLSTSCRADEPYWPVHYWGPENGFRWNANGPDKAGFYYFVEYPTGKE